jgi:KaiC/GvpD/RAD55 family RecA-like ATPase
MSRVLPLPVAETSEPLANVQAEAELLGAMLVENELIPTVAATVDADCFFEPVHRRIFEALVGEHSAGRRVTATTLRPRFQEDDGLLEFGGVVYLMRLTSDSSGLLASREIAEQIADLSVRRRRRDALTGALRDCEDLTAPLADVELPVSTSGPGLGLALPFEWAGDVKPALDGFWLIDCFLAKSGPAAIFGAPGSGKTFLALSIAVCVAEARPWAGRHVEGGFVLYVVAEGQTGFRNRLSAMIEAGRLTRTAPFAFVPTPLDLQSPTGDVGPLIATIRGLAKTAGQPPALIVIDTLSKTFGGGSENSDDMARYVANCERISSAFDCLTLIVHHPSKNGDARSERGHSSLRGGIVTSIHVEGSDGLRTAKIVKQKDGQEGITVAFRLDPIVLGKDSRGNEVTTCLVEFVDIDDTMLSANAGTAKSRLTGRKKIAFDAIETEIALHGERPPSEIPHEVIDRSKVLKVIPGGQAADKLKAEFFSVVDADADNRADTAARTARRAIGDLKAAGILGSWEDWLWIA